MVLSSVPSDRVASSEASVIATSIATAAALQPVEWTATALPKTRLFGTDGIRGRVGDWLTTTLARQVGFWAGQTLQESAKTIAPVIIGQDSRNSSAMLALALAEGLTAAGLEVWDLGLCPTPTVAHLTSTSGALGGVMISASHNPPEDNGIKFFDATGTKLAPALQNQIESALRGEAGNLNIPAALGEYYQRPELVEGYVRSLYTSLPANLDLSGMKIVLDLAWGAAAQLGFNIFSALGAEVMCLHDQPDGDRINVNCGSTHLGSLQAAVKEHCADLGFAFDGDADRVMAVDAQGRVVDGDYILYLWGQELRSRGRLPNDAIVTTVMANLGFERAWTGLGGTFVRTPVGDQYVHAEMVRSGAMLGGEQSGHILCPHYSVSGDGMLTALHLAAIVCESGVSLSELVDRSFQTYPQLLRNVRVEDRDRRLNWQNCEMLERSIAQAEAAMGDQGRILVRASGTEPVLRIMVEAANAELVSYWTDYLAQVAERHLAA